MKSGISSSRSLFWSGNCGGALSPLGDPPLLVGFLRGVPFFWPAIHLWLPLLVLAVPVLLLCLGVRHLFRAAGSAAEAAKTEHSWRPEYLSVDPADGRHPGRRRLASRQRHPPVRHESRSSILPSRCWNSPASPSLKCLRRRRSAPRTALPGMPCAKSPFCFSRFSRRSRRFSSFCSRPTSRPIRLPGSGPRGIASAILDAAPTYLIFFEAAGGHAANLSAAPARSAHRHRGGVGILRARDLSWERPQPHDPRDRVPPGGEDARLFRVRGDHDPHPHADLCADELLCSFKQPRPVQARPAPRRAARRRR